MRTLSVLTCLFVPAFATSQTPELVAKANATLYILRLQDPSTGAFKVTPDGKPSLRACNGGAKGLKYLGYDKPIPHAEKLKAFVLSCYEPKTGAFAEPGGQPDVTITSIGVMAAIEVGVPAKQVEKSLDYLKANAKSFDEIRIGAAALEALNAKPDWLPSWYKVCDAQLDDRGIAGEDDSFARDTASVLAVKLRLGVPLKELKNGDKMPEVLKAGQGKDGGYGRHGAEKSDFESTYRVMRALMLMKAKPQDTAKMKSFLLSCGHKDGGFGVAPGEPSTMSGTYYYAAIMKWLDEVK